MGKYVYFYLKFTKKWLRAYFSFCNPGKSQLPFSMKYTLVLYLGLMTLAIHAQTIERVEPPNWWVGMEHSEIQVLVYGKDIAQLQPQLTYPGVQLDGVVRVSNPNYLFLNIRIAEAAHPGVVPIVFEQNGLVSTTCNFPLEERPAGRNQLVGFNTTDAIYLITPDRFVNGDRTNDAVEGTREQLNRSFKGGRHGGDIAGIRQSLDYIHDLGFTSLWLNPLLENDMEQYSYHGYSTTDFYKVDPHYGSNEDYLNLANEARAKGMGLIMDMIVNHCGLFHWWMDDLPTEDWINQWPEYTQTNHKKTLLQDPYATASDKRVFSDGWFVPTMPDLNQRNELMARYLIQNSIWWVEYLGLTGIRMDTYPYPDMEYMADWTAALTKEYPDLNIVGEEWNLSPAIVSYWQKGKVNANGYNSFLRSVMDFPLQAALTKALTEEESWSTGWTVVYEMLAHDFMYADPQNLVIFPDNHDMSRIYTQLDEDYRAYQQAIAYLLTIRGIPQIYYGTEILMTNPGTEDHGIIRSDFPGGWAGDKVNAFTGAGLTKQQVEARSFMQRLLIWRKTATAVHYGKLRHFVPEDGVYVYFRYDDQQKIMVVLNKNTEPVSLALERFREVLTDASTGVDVISGQSHQLGDTLDVGSASVLILEVK